MSEIKFEWIKITDPKLLKEARASIINHNKNPEELEPDEDFIEDIVNKDIYSFPIDEVTQHLIQKMNADMQTVMFESHSNFIEYAQDPEVSAELNKFFNNIAFQFIDHPLKDGTCLTEYCAVIKDTALNNGRIVTVYKSALKNAGFSFISDRAIAPSVG